MNLIEEIKEVLFANNNFSYILDGLRTTICVTMISLIFALIIGLFIAIVRNAKNNLKPSWKNPSGFFLNLLDRIVKIYVTIVRGTPSTIQLLIVFNVILANANSLLLVAIVTFTINSSAYMSEVIRGGLQSVDKGEIEAARSLGLSYKESIVKVILPQAIKNSLPALGNEVITLFKETSISGFIGLVDLTRAAAIIISKTFKAAIPYFTAAIIYLIIVLILEKIFKKLEEKYSYA